MNSLFGKLKKLRGRSLDEFRVRGEQMMHAQAERCGWSRQSRLPTNAELLASLDPERTRARTCDDLLEHFRTRRTPRFFAGTDDAQQTLALINRSGAEHASRSETIERAHRIRLGKFDLLGLQDLDFGVAPDWHLEPAAGLRAPVTHWSRIAYLDPRVAGDKKITWELNRHGYFATLGRAYLYTNDEIHAATFAAHLASWMDANPPKQGINWASSLEVAFRAVAWLWALHFFRASPHLTPALFTRLLKFLFIHARHLETYLSTYFSPNTHLTGEALGLYYIGTTLPEFKHAPRWRAIGRQVFLDTMARHVKADGVYFEHASYYHRYTADFCLHFHILAQLNGDTVPQDFQAHTMLLLDHLMSITKPDGATPRYGDDDGGRFVALDESALTDFRTTLRTGAAFFGRSDYKRVAQLGAGDTLVDVEETAWLLGANGIATLDALDARPPADTSRAFTASGYCVMRDAWTKDANYMLFDGGTHGAKGGAHAHADALSFELAAHGRTLLVDPGTFTYTKSQELRDLFRTTAAHNTLTIDGESSSLPATAFAWRQIADGSLERWVAGKRFDFAQATHDGYMRLQPAPARHTRRVLFLKNDYWILRDTIATTGAHLYDLHFHFAADCHPEIEEIREDKSGEESLGNILPAVRERASGRSGLDVHTFGIAAGAWRRESGWVTHAYGARTAAPVCIYSAQAAGAQELITFLVPRAAGAPATGLRQIEAIGGTACELRGTSHAAHAAKIRDVMLARALDGSEIKTARFATDGESAWMRLRETGTLEASDELIEFVIIGGSRLAIDNVEVLRASQSAGFFSARLASAEELEIETDASGEWTIATLGARRVTVNDVTFDVGEMQVARFHGSQLTGGEDRREFVAQSLQETKD